MPFPLTNVSGLILFAHGEDLFQHCPFFENFRRILLHTAIFLSYKITQPKTVKILRIGCILNVTFTQSKGKHLYYMGWADSDVTYLPNLDHR